MMQASDAYDVPTRGGMPVCNMLGGIGVYMHELRSCAHMSHMPV